MLKKTIFLTLSAALFCGQAMAGGVTNIKEIVNNTPMMIEVRKSDIPAGAAGAEIQTTNEIPANGGTWTGDMWIPWADNRNDFLEKFLEIKVYRGGVFWLWQSGDYVRSNNRKIFVDNGRRAFGESRAGGERRLIISMASNRPVFRLERYQR